MDQITPYNERPMAKRISLSEMTGVKPASSNKELWTSRDPLGNLHKLKQVTSISNEPKDTRVHDHKTMARGSLQTHVPVMPRAAKSPRRRVLPTPPRNRGDHSKRHTGVGQGNSLRLAGDPKPAAVPKTPLSHSRAVHDHPAAIQAAVDGQAGEMAPATHQPIYQNEGEEPLWPTDTLKMKLDYIENGPIPIAERPPWQSLVGDANSIPGDEIQPVLGRVERHYSNEQQFQDRHLIQSLRIEEDPNVSWRMDKVRRKVAVEGAVDDGDLPDVFIRLLDHKRFTGSHKARYNKQGKQVSGRFSKDGKGLGLQGRRDDDELQVAIAGKATITRTDEPEMDAPNKPMLPWAKKKMHPDSFYTTSLAKVRSGEHGLDDRLDEDFAASHQGKLAAEHTRLSSKVDKPFASTIPKMDDAVDEGEYEDCRKARQQYQVDPNLVRSWQVTA